MNRKTLRNRWTRRRLKISTLLKTTILDDFNMDLDDDLEIDLDGDDDQSPDGDSADDPKA